ncbi:hypothetical protein NDU88_004047, partial [Pleurodeles waltl]
GPRLWCRQRCRVRQWHRFQSRSRIAVLGFFLLRQKSLPRAKELDFAPLGRSGLSAREP